MNGLGSLRGRLERLGSTVTSQVWRLGYASRFLAYLVLHSGTALRRFHLTIAEIYFAGVLSLVIILVSGLFVVMVLALQGYETLQRFGASESLGVVDYVYFMAAGRVIAKGTPDEIRSSPEPFVNQFVNGKPDGPVPFHYPAPDYRADLELAAA